MLFFLFLQSSYCMGEKKYTLEELLKYKEMLKKCSEQHLNTVFLNDSRVHAVMVMSALLDTVKNKDNNKTMKMFCGKFSHFMDKTGERVAKYVDGLNASSEDKSKFSPFEDLMTSLGEFFNNDGRLELIVTSDLHDISGNRVHALIGKAIMEKKMQVWQLDSNLALDHFAVIGSAFRMENSDEEKTAICCFNDQETAGLLNDVFDDLKTLAIGLSIPTTIS